MINGAGFKNAAFVLIIKMFVVLKRSRNIAKSQYLQENHMRAFVREILSTFLSLILRLMDLF